ncbi:MAG: hypothetical protein M3Y87_05000 [Myxococcota bacterium]|nr:hypothetical protein [Myxococcota bacterium]
MRFARPLAHLAACAWLLIVLLACCTSREVMQSGIVPFSEPLAPPTSHGSGDLYAGASGLTYLEPSDEGAELGHYVPAGQINLVGSLRPIAGLVLRPVGLLAVPSGASPISSGLLPAPTAPSFGGGIDVGYTWGDEDVPYLVHPHVGVLVTGIAMTVQDPSAGAQPFARVGWMAVIEGGVDVGYWVTPELLVLGSIDVRNGPRVERSVVACDGDEPPYTGFGDFTLNGRVSAELEITRGFGVVAGVGFPVIGSPFTSYPIVSLGLRGTFGDARQGFRRSRAGAREPTPDEEAAAEARERGGADALTPPAPDGAIWAADESAG